MPNTTDMRDTDFEIAGISQRPDGLLLHCTKRGTVNEAPPPPLTVKFEKLSEKDNALLVEMFCMLEREYKAEYQLHVESPDHLHAELTKARETIMRAEDLRRQLEAAELEAQRLQLENLNARAELEELQSNLSVIQSAAPPSK